MQAMGNDIYFANVLKWVQLVCDAPSAKGEEFRRARARGNIEMCANMGAMEYTLCDSPTSGWRTCVRSLF